MFCYTFLCLLTPFNNALLNRSIQNQINYLSIAMSNGSDDEIQNRFPEGKLFSNSLLALSIIEYCNQTKKFENKYSHIVDNCIKRIQSEKALDVFDPNLNPKYGIFYLGWANLVYSKYIQSDLIKLSKLNSNVVERSNEIETTILKTQKDSLRILNTYKESNWPADNLIGIASISDKELQTKWINLILSNTENQSGLIHHAGDQKNIVRGSSTSLITYCLNTIGFTDMKIYNEKFKNIFIDNYFGIELVREYENGSNQIDLDSGPIVFGYGASATIMNIKTQASLNNPNAKITWAAINLISMPINIFKRKYLILKKEPMLDLFMLWASTGLIKN